MTMTDFQREIEPAASLEDRVVASLRGSGLIGRPAHKRALRVTLAVAAGVLLFVSGYTLGAADAPQARPDGMPRFMLLLHETPATASTGIAEAQLVEEYREWARAIGSTGTAIQGEKLTPEPGQTFSGFFIVTAPSREAAEAIAASSPHRRYGGRIEIRAIDPT
jgi:hypothetical protein